MKAFAVRTLGWVGLFAAASIGVATPAFAHEGRYDWNGVGRHRHHYQEGYWGGGPSVIVVPSRPRYYRPAPVVVRPEPYYAPAPVYVEPRPGVSIDIGLPYIHIR